MLNPWIGHWDVTATNFEGPEPVAMHAVEETTAVCGGLWLRAKVTGTDFPFSGTGFTGWDSTRNEYVGVWVDSMSATPWTSHGKHDAKTGGFTFDGLMPSPEGARTTWTTMEFPNADTRVETTHIVDKDGKKTKFMELRATRQKDTKTAPASAKKADSVATDMPNPHDPMHQHLAPFAGSWKSTMKMSAPGMPEMPPSAMASEDVMVCDDLWLLTHATGEFSGMAFEGFGLTGYDPTQKKFVSFWVDNFAAYLMQSTGTCDKSGSAFTMSGASIDMMGKPGTTIDTTKWDSKDHYVRTMGSTGKDGKDAGTMFLECTRSK